MDVITKHINASKENLINIIKCLDNNIEFTNNKLWNEHINEELLNKVINNYYDNYYLNKNIDYNKINKYLNVNKNINTKLKKILLSIVDYYESNNEIPLMKNNEETILYLDILIYIGLKLYESNFKNIDEPKKIEKVINNIIDNFAKIKFRKEKDLNKLIINIKDNIINNNYFNRTIDKLNKDNSYNKFIRINKDKKYYKVLHDYKINELNNYDIKDINIVSNNLKINEETNKISFDLAYFTEYKLLNNNKKYELLFPITKECFNNNYEYYIKERNQNILDNIKLIIDYKEIEGDYNFINLIRENNIDLFIEVNKSFETNNYNLFMDIKKVVVTEDFLSINEKYMEIWKDMNINFIVKNLDNRVLLEKDLLRKKEV